MLESAYKRRLVDKVKRAGYARRLEDQFAVGLPDLILAIGGARRVYIAEAKIIKGAFFGPTPRQLLELQRINNSGNEHVEGIVLGFDPRTDRHYYGTPAARLYVEHTLYAETYDELITRLREL